MALSPGTRLGPYEVIALIGEGGMGEVYKAEDTRLGRHVALKFLRQERSKDPQALARFRREARAASALNHPNICTLYDIGKTEAGHFIVMELIVGRTLRHLAGQCLAVDTLTQVGAQIAKALAVAHAAGIVHRDIKPENIMVRDDGYVKVLDFGLARLMPESVPQSRVTTTTATALGARMGTVRYMSPEQARGDLVDSATDMFSLGVVLYEGVTGQHPFSADSDLATLHAIASNAVVPPSRLNPEIPVTLDAVVLQMLDKNVGLRPSAAEVDRLLGELAGKGAGLLAGAATVRAERHTVGRERERAELRAAFDAAAAGHGRLLCVAGEPGIGKTTLVEDFLADLAAGGAPCWIARGQCSERLAGAEAYLPFLDALESLLRTQVGESSAGVMKLVAPTWYVQVAPLAADDPVGERLSADLRAGSQERLKRELSAFFQEVSRVRPLVLFLDDVHWADASTVDLVAYLGTKLAALRVLLVTTFRPSELALSQHPFVPVKLDLQARGVCREMPLDFLSREDVERYLALEFPEHHFPAGFPALIYTKTEGSPLFMVDVIRDLRGRQVIAREDGRWTLAQAVPAIERGLPESVRSMIQRKIGQLSEADRRLLVGASVQGHTFDSAVVANALGMDAAEVEERLEVLDRVHAFVRFVREPEFPDRALTLQYAFVHGLYHNALYGSLKPTRKASLSAAVAEALLRSYGDRSSEVASELALLLEAARSYGRAADYFRIAAQNAARVFANQEAVVLARRGLHVLEALPDSSERSEKELTLLTTLGDPLISIQGAGSSEAKDTFARLRVLCQQIGESPQVFPALAGLWSFHFMRAEVQTARDVAERLLSVAQRTQDAGLLAKAHLVLGITLDFLGEHVLALEHMEQGIAFYDPARRFMMLGYDLMIVSLGLIADILWSLGYPDQALEKINDVVTRAEELSHPPSLVWAFWYAGLIHQFRKESQMAQERAEAGIGLAREHEDPSFMAYFTFWRGWSLAAQGQHEEGLVQMRESLAAMRSMGSELSRPHALALLAEVYGASGKPEEGLTAVAEGLAGAHSTGERYYEAELYRVKGELLLMQTIPGEQEAETCFRQALAVARRQRAKSWELPAAMSLGRLWQKQGKKAEARQMLAEIYGWFTEGFDTADLKDAKAALEEWS